MHYQFNYNLPENVLVSVSDQDISPKYQKSEFIAH